MHRATEKHVKGMPGIVGGGGGGRQLAVAAIGGAIPKLETPERRKLGKSAYH